MDRNNLNYGRIVRTVRKIVVFMQRFFYSLSLFFYQWSQSSLRIVLKKYFEYAISIFFGNERSKQRERNAERGEMSYVSMVSNADLELLSATKLTLPVPVESGSGWFWATPPFGQGSGGHHDIFMLSTEASSRGIDSTVALVDGDQHINVDIAKKVADERYGFKDLSFQELLKLQDLPAELVVATGWQTFAAALRVPSRKYAYLIQDYEPYFYPRGTHTWLAEQTYKFGVPAITAGPWLLKELGEKFGVKGDYFELGYDPSNYRLPSELKERKVIVAYYRESTPRRSSDFLMEALRRSGSELEDYEIHIVGGAPGILPRKDANVHGSLTHSGLAELYSLAALTIVISMSNTSLVPVEAMACGSSVLTNESEANRMNLKGTSAQFSDMNIFNFSQAIVKAARANTSAQAIENANSVLGREWPKQLDRAVTFLANL